MNTPTPQPNVTEAHRNIARRFSGSVIGLSNSSEEKLAVMIAEVFPAPVTPDSAKTDLGAKCDQATPCEGCGAPAIRSDSRGEPLCKACYDELPALVQSDSEEDWDWLENFYSNADSDSWNAFQNECAIKGVRETVRNYRRLSVLTRAQSEQAGAETMLKRCEAAFGNDGTPWEGDMAARITAICSTLAQKEEELAGAKRERESAQRLLDMIDDFMTKHDYPKADTFHARIGTMGVNYAALLATTKQQAERIGELERDKHQLAVYWQEQWNKQTAERDTAQHDRDAARELLAATARTLAPFANFRFGSHWSGHQSIEMTGDTSVCHGYDDNGKETGVNVMYSDFERARIQHHAITAHLTPTTPPAAGAKEGEAV